MNPSARRRIALLVVLAVLLVAAILLFGGLLTGEPPRDETEEPRERREAGETSGDTSGSEAPAAGEPEGDAETGAGKAGSDAASPSRAEEPDRTAPKRGSVEGTLTFEDGTPVANRPVWLWGETDIVARTDAEGRFRIDDEWTSPHGRELMVGPPAAAVSVGNVTLRPGDTVRFDATMANGVDVVLLVVGRDDGKPLPGIWVALDTHPDGPGDPFAAGTTGSDGTVRLALVPRRAWQIRIDHEGYRSVRDALDLTVGAPSGPHRVTLERTEPLVLRVVPPPEKVGVLVNLHLLPEPPREGNPQYPYVGRLDAAGVFRGDAPPPGRYRGFLLLEGIGQRALEPFDVLVRQPVEITVKRPEGGGVSGRLVGPGDDPVADARVELHPRGVAGLANPAARTAPDGSFRLETVPAGRYDVHVRLGGQTLLGFMVPIEIPEGGATGLRIRLPRGGTVKGRVVDGSGSFYVQLRRGEDERWVSGGSVMTSENGSFVARHLRPGRWRLDAQAFRPDGGSTNTVEIEIRDGGAAVEVALRVRPPATFVLLLETVGGAPFTGVLNAVALTAAGDPFPRILTLRADETGRAELRALPPGRYSLRLYRPGRATQTVKVEIEVREGANEPVRVRLPD